MHRQQHSGPTFHITRLTGLDLGNPLPGVLHPAAVRPHPSLPGHVGLVDTHGTYYIVKLGESGARSAVTAAYELQLSTGGLVHPVRKAWRVFEALPDDGLLCCTAGSNRIMFAQLPLCEGEAGPVFLFGAHEGPVLCLASNAGLLLSGGADGCARLWSLDSGAQLDWARAAGGAGQVTAVAFVGPLMAATGTEQGDVCMYDISTRRMEAVQRFRADAGPVTALAARVTPAQAAGLPTATAPRTLDGGGVVAGPAGLPWRCPPGIAVDGKDTQLAVASSVGWVHVYAAAGAGEAAWQHCHAGAVEGTPHLSYSPDGGYLAVGSGSHEGRLVVLGANSMQVVHEQHFPPGGAGAGGSLLGAGFLPASAGGSSLVALQRGGSLAGGLRLRMYAAPAGQLPCLLELTLPLQDPGDPLGQREAELAEGQDFLDWLERKAAAPLPAGGPPPHGSRSPGAAAASAAWTRPGGHATSPQRPGAPVAPGSPLAPSPSSPLVPVRGGVADRTSLSRSLAEPWASPRSAAGASASAAAAAGLPPHDSPARTWQAQRPNTQPAPRSWLTGLPPRADFLPQPQTEATQPPPNAAPASAHALHGSPRAPGWADPDTAGYSARDAEAELPHSGILLPASGIPATASALEDPYGDANHDDGDGGTDPAAGEAPQWEYGAAAGPASWRGGDLSMGPELFRSFAPAATGGIGSHTTGRHNSGGSHALGGGAGGMSSSFRFQPLPQAQPHPQSLGPASAFGSATPMDDSVAQLGPNHHTGHANNFRHGGDGSSPSLAPQQQGQEEQEGGADGQGTSEWDARDSTLERTAYFGGELAAALRSAADAGPADAGGQQEGAQPTGEERHQWWWHHKGPQPHTGLRASQDGKAADIRDPDGSGENGRQAEDTEEEDLVPRASASLPRPQRPVPRPQGQQPSRPPEHRPPPLPYPRSGDTAEQPEGDGAEEARPLPPGVRRNIAHGTRAFMPSSGAVAGAPVVTEADPGEPQLQQGAEAGRLDEEDGDGCGDGGGRWAGWQNADLLGADASTREGAEGATAGARRKGPFTRPVPAPRPPPSFASARLQIFDGAAGQGFTAASARVPRPPLEAQPQQRPELQDWPEPTSEADGIPLEEEPEPLVAARPPAQPHRGRAVAQRYPADDSQDGYGRDGDAEATPVHSVSASGGQSPAQSLLQSPAVLLGSPAGSATTRGSAGPYRAAPGAVPRQQGLRQRPLPRPQIGSVEGSSAASNNIDGTAAATGRYVSGRGGVARQHLQHLRQHRQHQQLQRLKQPAWAGTAGTPAEAIMLAHGPRGRDGNGNAGGDSGDVDSYQDPAEGMDEVDSGVYGSMRPLLQPPEVSESPWGAPGVAVESAAVAGYGGAELGQTGAAPPRPPPAAPAFGSTALLLRRMQALEQVLARAAPEGPPLAAALPKGAGATRGSVKPGRGGGRGGGRGAGLPRDLAATAAAEGVSEAALEEAARRAATAAANVPPGVQLYQNLPAADPKPQQPKVAKQLHPGWVASRQLKPELGSLWRPEEQVSEISNTRGVALYVPPTPADVARSLLRLQVL